MNRSIIVVTVVLLGACAARPDAQWRTYENVSASELRADTLYPGDRIRLEYQNGDSAELFVREVRDDVIIGDDGKEFRKTGIASLTIKSAPNSQITYEIDEQDLEIGHTIFVEYADGREAIITVADMTAEHIIADDGGKWPRTGITALRIRDKRGGTVSYVGGSILKILDVLACVSTGAAPSYCSR